VLWVDALPASSFHEGFGSHTRMLGGQGKDIRYHMNAARALELHKQLLLRTPHTGHDAGEEPLELSGADLAAVRAAGSVEELWQVRRRRWFRRWFRRRAPGRGRPARAAAGGGGQRAAVGGGGRRGPPRGSCAAGRCATRPSPAAATTTTTTTTATTTTTITTTTTTATHLSQAIGEDSWVLVPLGSVYRRDRTLEGTRLTLVRQPNGFEFSIRTPGTPHRWADYEEEMGAAWGAVLEALEGGSREEVADAVLAFGYFWYNLMPLARGTAGVGYASVLGLFYTAGLQVTASIPPNYQVGGGEGGLARWLGWRPWRVHARLGGPGRAAAAVLWRRRPEVCRPVRRCRWTGRPSWRLPLGSLGTL
jgi:hypothetical protein